MVSKKETPQQVPEQSDQRGESSSNPKSSNTPAAPMKQREKFKVTDTVENPSPQPKARGSKRYYHLEVSEQTNKSQQTGIRGTDEIR